MMNFLAMFQEQTTLTQTQQNTFDPHLIAGIIAAYVVIFAVFYVIAVALVMIPSWFLCKKTGYSPWLSLLCLLPSLGVLVLLYILAFAEWPSQRAAYAAPYVPPVPPTPPLPPQA